MGCAGSTVVPGREMHMNIMLETVKNNRISRQKKLLYELPSCS